MTISSVGNRIGGTSLRQILLRYVERWTFNYRTAAVVLLVAAAVVAFLTFEDYGVTWDEQVQNDYGKMVLNYYLTGFQDRSALTFFDLWLYGGLFDSVAAALNKFSQLGEYETRHLLNAITGLVGVIGCWKLARQYGGDRGAFWAMTLLLLIPTWYGDMFNNPKDVPFAACFVWSLYYLAAAIPTLPRPPFSLCLRLGLAIGLCLGVRVGGLLLFVYMAILGVSFLWLAFRAHRDLGTSVRQLRDGVVHFALPTLLIAYPVMLLFWPWAQSAPFSHPFEALRRFSELPQQIEVLFNGHVYTSDHLPWYYLPETLAIRLPELVLAALAGGLALALLRLRQGGWRLERDGILRAELLVLAIAWPLAYVILTHAHMFDGMRHFIFLLPPIAVVAGISLDRMMQYAARWGHALLALYVATGLFLSYQVWLMASLHPDQYVYYNELVGGVDDAAGRFEMDYWGNSLAEAVHALESELRETYGENFDKHQFKIRVCDAPFSAKYFFPPNFKLTNSDLQADFYIAFTRYNCHKSLRGLEIYRVERLGALLAVVLDRRYLKSGPVAHR